MARSFPSSSVRRRAIFWCTKALIAACAVASVAAAAGAAATEPPRWLTARDLSEAGADAIVPAVAVDPRGNVVVVWAQAKDQSWTVQEAERPMGGNWSAPRALSAPANQVGSPEVVIAGTHTVAVWERYDGRNLITQASERSAKTGAWSAPVSLSPSGRDTMAPHLALDARGDVAVVWASVSMFGWTIQSAYRPAGGKWQLGVVLDAPTQGTAAPDVAFDSSGNAVALWASTTGAGWQIRTAYRPVGGTWGAASTLSGSDAGGLLEPRLGIDGNGDAVAVWSRNVGTNTIVEQATRSAATGVWSSARQISPAGSDALAPRIAINRRGNAAVVWTSSDQQGLSVVAVFRQPGKEWGPPAVLAGAVAGPLAPEIGLDARGDALCVWSYSAGGGSRVQAASRDAGGPSWSAPRTLSKPGADALPPQLALDADGDGAVVWARYSGQMFVIQAVGYDTSGPELDQLTLPDRGLVGKRLTFSVSPKDVWAAVRTVRWSFGDGTLGTGRLTGHAYARPGRYAARVTATDSFGHVRSVRRWVSISAA